MSTPEVSPEVQQLADQMGVPVEQVLAAAAQAAVNPGIAAEDPRDRQLALQAQELQQLRAHMQTLEQGRVVGSGGLGLGATAAASIPDIGSIEPGLRFAYFNGLISDEDLEKKVAPIFVELLKAHQGGVI